MKAGWEVRSLGELCRIELGSTPARGSTVMWDEKKITSNVWLSIADMPQALHAVALDSKEYVSEKAAATMRIVAKGTLIVSFKLTLGRLAYAGRDLFTNEAIASLNDLDTTRIDQRFLYWALTAFDWDKAAEGDVKVKGKTLNKAKLKLLPIPLPPLAEQKRIVAVLDEAFEGLDRARANAEANLADARELFESYLFKALSNPSADWIKAPLGTLCQRMTVGHVGPMVDRYCETGIPFLRSQNIKPYRIDLTDVKFIDGDFMAELKKSELRPGDVAIVRTGYPGTCAVIPEDLEIANCADLVIARTGPDLNPHFMALLLNSRYGQQHVAAVSVGAAQKHFNVGAAKATVFAIPPLSVQERFVEMANEFRSKGEYLKDECRNKVVQIDDLRQSLLQKAFSGELT